MLKTKSFKQKAIIAATPAEVYEALVNPLKHTAFSGSTATNTDSLTTDFSTFDGYATGRNIELVKDKLIKQTWRAVEENWAEDYYSEVVFKLLPHENGTQINFTQKNVPEEYADAIANGWEEFYWQALNDYFAK